jgi:hypothetical protein
MLLIDCASERFGDPSEPDYNRFSLFRSIAPNEKNMTHPFRTLLASTFIVLSLSSSLAMAQYNLQDLQTLVDRKEYAEAVSHLRDIPPTVRDAAWDGIAVQALIGSADNVRKDGAFDAYRYLSQQALDYPSAAKDPRVTAKLVELGIAAMKARTFYSREDRDKVVEEVLALDPSAIVPLVTEAGYDDPRQRLYVWIDRNPQAARNNQVLKTVVLRNVGKKYANETAEMTQTKFAALKKTGWNDEWVKSEYAKLSTYATEMIGGNFFHEDIGRALLKSLEEAGYPNEEARVRFFAPLTLMRSSMRSSDPLESILPASAASLKKAERELLQSKPESAFWFGGEWDDALWAKVRKLFPEVAKLAVEECNAHRKDDSKDPVHVSYGGCRWIK